MKKELSMLEVQREVAKIMKATVEVCDKNNILYYCQAGTALGAVRHKGPIPWDYDADLIIPVYELNRFIECCEKYLPSEYWVDYHITNPKGYREFPRIGKRGFSTKHLHLDVFLLIGLPDDKNEQHKIVEEAHEYVRVKKFYINKFRILLWSLKHGKIKDFFSDISILIRRDTSFVDKTDEMCSRYPYKDANYVMNPFGKYGEKNIFKKEVYGEGRIVPYLDFFVRIPSEIDFYLKQYYGDYMKFPSQTEIDKAKSEKFFVEEV